jgi:hypothetical protein
MKPRRAPAISRPELDVAAFAMDDFKSDLIVAYEKALLGGVLPSSALAAALDWASSELERLLEEPAVDLTDPAKGRAQ